MPAGTGSIRAGRAYVELFADGRKLYAGLRQASAKLKAFGASIREVGSRLMMLGGAALAPLAAVARLYGGMGDQLSHMSDRTGIAVEVLSALSFAAEQSGVEIEDLENGIRKMQKTIVDAATGSQSAIDALGRLGITVKDLDGLSPDQQLRLIADRMAEIADPTIRAATAMSIFGKNGTKMLPLLSLGADGIARLEQQAGRLGLVIGTEDAEAAHRFNRLLETLWSLVKRAGFALGSALAPALSEVAKWLGGAVMALTEWVKANQEAVVLALKVVAGILAAGAALVVVGTVLGVAGRALGAVFTIASGVGSVFSLLGTILGGLLSPIGLVIAGVLALGGYILYATGAGVKALGWLAKSFGTLLADAREAIGGIGDALAAGDMALAAKVLWTLLKLEWARGTGALKTAWANLTGWLGEQWNTAWDGIRAAAEIVWDGIVRAWYAVCEAMTKAWHDAVSLIRLGANAVGGALEKAWNWVSEGGPWGNQKVIERKNREVDERTTTSADAIRRKWDAKVKATEDEYKRKRDAQKGAHDAAMAAIGKESKARSDATKAAADKAIQDAEQAVATARKEFQDAVQAAKDKRKAKEAAGEGPGAMQAPEDLLAKAKKAVGNLGDLMEATAKRTIGVSGTFNAAALLGLQAGGMEDRIAQAAERTAKGVEALRQDVRNNKAAFQ
jgi:hypothetical protein